MATTLFISPERFIAGDFDSQKRYLRSGVSGTFLPIPHNHTIDLVTNSPFGGPVLAFRYSLNGLVRQQTLRFQALLGNIAMSPGSHNATFTDVKF